MGAGLPANLFLWDQALLWDGLTREPAAMDGGTY